MDRIKFIFIYITTGLSFLISRGQQIGNYVNNGSFEDLRSSCNPGLYLPVLKYWSGIDTTKNGFFTANITCSNVPLTSICDYQYPRSGGGFVMQTSYIQNSSRGYFRNRLKGTLQAGKIYCVRFYLNVRNCSPFGIDAYGVYFGNNSLDTISYANTPITFLTPQVQNPSGNFITDTLNWQPVTGTFVATGIEKFLVIGNFTPNNATATVQIQPPYSFVWCDINVDDVSCIDIDLPAYAGPDQPLLAGDSVYIGREQDFAIDKACLWYQLPNTTTPIDTAAGLWVKPATTTTYVVKQQIYCGGIKWDTVVVYRTAVGINELKNLNDKLVLFPNPAQEELQLQGLNGFENEFDRISIYNNLGQLMREEEIDLKNGAATINTGDLPEGAYQLKLLSQRTESRSIIKKLLIAR